MVKTTWNSCLISGSTGFIFKEKLKLIKKSIKMWKEHTWDVGEKAVQEAKSEMVKWDIVAE